jgi:cytoskeleton protein RodZ
MNNAENNQDELTSTDEVAEPPSDPVRRSPGAMLMAQRETLELSLQQVADQLHLTMHFVRAIESDSYEKLPGDVFVRGYIRTYARLLRLDPDQVLMIYDEFNFHKMARKEEAIKRRDRRRKDKNRPWIIVSGIAFVSVAVALWYLTPTQTTPEAVINATSELTGSLERPAEAPTNTMSGAALQIDFPDQVAAETATELTTDELTAAQSDETLPAAGEIADAVSSADLSSSAMLPAESGRTVMQYWPGTDELRIAFSADSSAQIEHKGGAEAHEQIHVAGETLVIRGTAPFSVLLGDARNVSLIFNGRQIDISSNIRVDNSARLSIGM